MNASSGDSDAMTKSDDEDDGSSDVSIVAACVAVSCLLRGHRGGGGRGQGSEYFAGYLLEQSLSVDNLFVFILLFEYFQVPLIRQTRVLNYGIYGALLMGQSWSSRASNSSKLQPILLVFAGILIFSSYKLLSEAGRRGGHERERHRQVLLELYGRER